MSEGNLIRAIMVAASRQGARLFRNNVGQLQDIEGRWVRYGVCNPGGADLIGWCSDGRFLAVEVKFGRTVTTTDQDRFIAAVQKSGGVGVIARSVEDVLAALQKNPPT
jgi:hypothetical protein